MSATLPPFHPHPMLRGGHSQTLAGFLLFRSAMTEAATRRFIPLDDGDQLVLHDDCPPTWTPGDRTALLMHGLAGCHASPYMQRIAAGLNARGVRTFRMDLRGCGAGSLVARLPYHSGRSEDAAAALCAIARLCPRSPTALIGFSLSGNIILKLLGESAARLPENLDRAAAVSPPIDLAACVARLRQGANRIYDRYFVRLLLRQVAARVRAGGRPLLPAGWPDAAASLSAGASANGPGRDRSGRDGSGCDDFVGVGAGGLPSGPDIAVQSASAAPPVDMRRTARPRGMAEFDAAFTAPLCGFGTAENYYRRCSAAQFIPAIAIPTLILTAADDPLVPIQAFQTLRPAACTTLQITEHGGHLGFITGRRQVPDRRWMDWRIIDWTAAD